MKNLKLLTLSIIGLLVLSQNLTAGGLDLVLLYGTRQIGLGGQQIAISNDAYSVFYNPGAMSFIDRPTFAINSMNLAYQYKAPLGGTLRKSKLSFSPLFYAGGVYPINEWFAAGLAVYPTALLGSKFTGVNYGPMTDREWGLDVMRIEIAPSLAVKFNQYLSFGAAYHVGYTSYKQNNGTFATHPTLAPVHIYRKTSVNGWDGKGAKIGLHLQDWNNLSAGLTYRPQLNTTLKGNTDQFTTLNPTTATTNATSQYIKLPQQLQVGVAYEFIPDTLLAAFTYEWTDNSIFSSTRLDSPTMTNAATQLNWKDGHTFHLGGEYTFHLAEESRFVRVNTGVVYDGAVTRKDLPVPGTPPDSPYIGGSLGTQYHVNQHVFGVALNGGAYTGSRTTALNTQANSLAVFPGKYELMVFLAAIDYQFKF